MEFRFDNKITALDVWKLSMHHIYRSVAGVCNIVFSIAIILLTVKFWDSVNEGVMLMLLFACTLFPIVQPLMVYKRAKRQIATLPKDMVIEINETGLHVTGHNQKSHIPWNRIRRVIKEYGMIVLTAEDNRGYMLTDKTLGEHKESFLQFVESKIKNKA